MLCLAKKLKLPEDNCVKTQEKWHIAGSRGPEERSIARKAEQRRVSWSLFTVFVAVAITVGSALLFSGIFDRQELQTINRRFEARQWLSWTPESLKRLNPLVLWNWHESHEQPRKWYAWDFTLSWLIENNHPKIKNKIVIFNHSVEDEPPPEAVKHFPWMQPLLSYPIRRQTVADMVELLAKSGARAIVLDNDFPQYSPDDTYFAEVIHKAASGAYGKKVPVFMVRALNSSSSSRMVTLVAPTAPIGILEQLQKLEPGVDVENKYTGMTCVDQDEDQVVRRAWNVISPRPGERLDSVVVKALRTLGEKIPRDLPDKMDIDFAGFPNSEHLFPIRPLSYLLDPQQKERFLKKEKSNDVSVDNAIVFIGDGITDIYSTPFTNEGLNLMSGTEILANALDTISRHSWPQRLNGFPALIYLLLSCLAGSALWCLWKSIQEKFDSLPQKRRPFKHGGSLLRLTADTVFFCFLLFASYIFACFAFAFTGLIVPVFVPSIALGLGALAAIVWEREREREQLFQTELHAQKEKHDLELEKIETEMAKQEVEAENREMYQDRKRRHEFVRRINHDLNAPVSVLNWTISELQMMGLEDQQARDKVSRLVKSSDKLCELIDQLVQSYDYEITPGLANNQAALCDLTQVVEDSVDGQQPLAQKHEDTLEWTKPEQTLWVKANSLELSRVVDNIIRNAIKHNPPHTHVFVTMDTNGSFHKILITDSGKGIAPEHLNHIFEPGYRVNPEKKDGHGLGLDIAKTLVEGMGGEISVTSTLGKGTTFQLKLPVCPEARAMHKDFLQDETLQDQVALNSRKKTLEIANKGTGERYDY